MNLIHQFLSTWFGFNKQQRNGVIVLCTLILALFIFRLSIHHFITPKPILIADFSNTKLPDIKHNLLLSSDSTNEEGDLSLFVFNPNTVSKEQLIKLGFKEKTANTFINYRNKGGQFRKRRCKKSVRGERNTL